jgi:putative ABC transport system permease protein
VGHRFRVGAPEFQGPWVKVIGVVGDTKHRSLDEPPSPAFYFPSFQMPSMAFNLVIRTPTEAAALIPAIRLEATRLHPDATITDVRTVAALIDVHVANRKMNLYLVAVFAGMALLLATVGVYGVIAYSVAQRTHELGVRLALGAGESRVIALVLRQGAALGLTGLLFGLATAATLSRFIATMLFAVGPFDVVTFGGVALVLSTVLLIATYVPARRAARIEPLSALRSE